MRSSKIWGREATTKKMFWENPYQNEFDATITGIDGNTVILNKTCFYPKGGGQVGDTGYLNELRVINTIESEGKKILHVLEKESKFLVGDLIHGKIDWERRYRIMKLHSAAHIVYYLMREVFGKECRPASPGHLDDEKDRSDYFFSTKLDREKLKEVEKKANEIIRDGREIQTWTEKSQRNWKLEPFPKMRCGGTHIDNTGEIGKIQVKRGKKPGKGKERIEISLSNLI